MNEAWKFLNLKGKYGCVGANLIKVQHALRKIPELRRRSFQGHYTRKFIKKVSQVAIANNTHIERYIAIRIFP